MTRLVFLDSETTGLDRSRHQPWEIAVIVRDGGPDREYCWRMRPDLTGADPAALRINRYYRRIGNLLSASAGSGHADNHPDTPGRDISQNDIAAELAVILDGATVVGLVPDFDAEIMRYWLDAYGQCWTADHHLVDVGILATGALRLPPPQPLPALLAAYGVIQPAETRHTALGDARTVRDLYDAVIARNYPADADEVLIWSNQRAMWWLPARCGYTGIIDEAGRYPRSEAQKIVAGSTLDGQLIHARVDEVAGMVREILDEVIVEIPVIQR